MSDTKATTNEEQSAQDFAEVIANVSDLLRAAAPRYAQAINLRVTIDGHSVTLDGSTPEDMKRAEVSGRNVRGVWITEDMEEDDDEAINELINRNAGTPEVEGN